MSELTSTASTHSMSDLRKATYARLEAAVSGEKIDNV
jgi:hypothetical protein